VKRVLGLGHESCGNSGTQWWWCSVTTKGGGAAVKNVVLSREDAYSLYGGRRDGWPVAWEKKIVWGGHEYVAVRFLDIGSDPRYVAVYRKADYDALCA
jgi:hypothetical protein